MTDPYFQESIFLRDVWNNLNKECFNSKLNELDHIGWGSEMENHYYGVYFPILHGKSLIGISKQFLPAEEANTKLHSIKQRDDLSKDEKLDLAMETENSSLIVIVQKIVAHEMIHQASFENKDSHTSHGEPFLRHCAGVADYFKLDLPDGRTAARWPHINA